MAPNIVTVSDTITCHPIHYEDIYWIRYLITPNIIIVIDTITFTLIRKLLAGDKRRRRPYLTT